MNFNYEAIGIKIRHYREENGLSQEELADIIGISWRHFNYIEHGERKASVEILLAIANALDITVDDLLSDFLTRSIITTKAETVNLLTDCNITEKVILIEMLKHLKHLLMENGI